jgi:hypothetical protein
MQHRTVPVQKNASQNLQLSDDECVRRLAVLIEHQDKKNFNEIVALIGRLTAPIVV